MWAMLLPQHQMNPVVKCTGGKAQARVMVPIQSIDPGHFVHQEAQASPCLPVFWQRPVANQVLCLQVYDMQGTVVKQWEKYISKAMQGHVCYLRSPLTLRISQPTKSCTAKLQCMYHHTEVLEVGRCF